MITISLKDEEALLIYGRLKRELSNMKSAKGVKIPKSEFQLYQDILDKFESQNPGFAKLIP